MADTFARMRQLVGTTAEWAANDIVLAEGEIGVERIGVSDVRAKCGNGTLLWSQLPYLSGTAAAVDAQVAAASAHAVTAQTQANRAEDEADDAAASAADAASRVAFWQGASASDPSTRIGGAALQTGDQYFNTTNDRMRVYEVGTGWIDYEATAQAAATTATTQAGIATSQAATATTQSGIATTQANTATTQAGIATAARVAAESARDAATVGAIVYASTAAAQADSGLANGAQYHVVSGLEIVRYRKDSSSASTELARYPSVSLVNTVFSEVTRETELFANASQKSWASPATLQTLSSAGTIVPAGLTFINGAAQALQIAMSGGGTGQIAAVQVDSAPLVVGDVIRLECVVQSISGSTTPHFGMAFGPSSGASAFGLGWRSTGALADLSVPSGVTGVTFVTTATLPTFAVNDKIAMDVRVLSGSSGSWTLRFYVEKNAVRYGPIDLPNVSSIDSIWFIGRGSHVMTDVRLTRQKAPRFLADFWPSSGSSVLYVSTTGSDSNSGTSSGQPLATISAALSKAASGAIIEVAGGEYRETVSVSNLSSVWIRAPHNQRVVILGSNRLTVTKTAGYTQVYQATLATKPTGMGGGRGDPMIFEWGTPSKSVLESERHPLQRGETNRLPYTEMLEAASLAELDTVGGRGKWWWSSGVIYFAATDGGDATAKRYEARARNTLVVSSGYVRLTRVDTLFSSGNGQEFRGCLGVMREDCRSLGNFRNGFSDDCATVLSYRDEAGGNGNDGINGTPMDYTGTGNRDVVGSAIYFDPWCHDNYDDGISFHTRGDASSWGGLFEYCTKAGIVHVLGSGCTAYSPTARKCFNGVYAATLPDDSRTQTVLRVVSGMVSGCTYNYRASDARLIAEGCRSIGATNTHYYQSDSGVLVATDCRHDGTATAKAGSVTVQTQTALT